MVLRSAVPHLQYMHIVREFLQRQAEEDARNKQFRARQFNPSHYKDVGVRRTARGSEPGGRKITQPKGPSFLSDDRLGYRRDVLEGRFADTHEAHRARHAESMARREVCFKIEGRNRLDKLEHAWYAILFQAAVRPRAVLPAGSCVSSTAQGRTWWHALLWMQ